MTNKTVHDINFSPKRTQNGDKILQKESGLVLKKQAKKKPVLQEKT